MHVDVHLVESIQDRLMQYSDTEIHTSKNALVQSISDLLYLQVINFRIENLLFERKTIRRNDLP